MKKIIFISLFLVAISLNTTVVVAQKTQHTRQSLAKEISGLEKDIAKQEKLLNKIKSDKRVTQNELKLINAKVGSRRKLVESLNIQIKLLENEIANKNNNINALSNDLKKLKSDYAHMIYLAYKDYKTNNSTAFILAAKDFNDATKRIDYIKRYNTLRERTAISIDSISHELLSQVEDMEKQRADIAKTKEVRDKELKSLRSEESSYKKSVNKLASEEKKVSKRLKEKEKAKRAAQAKLQKLIADEAKKGAAKKRTAAEEKRIAELSDKFDQNKGKFPFPVQGGIIIEKYGKQYHPTQKGVTKNNTGIDFAAEKGSQVMNIFEGSIVRVVHIKGMLNCVMVEHGDYIAVYTNLETISVKPGENLVRNQVIGTIPTSDDNNDYFVHFELWRGGKHTDPEPWFAR